MHSFRLGQLLHPGRTTSIIALGSYPVSQPPSRSEDSMSNRSESTCSDCYFRRAGLCALPGETICPTFRAVVRGALEPPRQPRLVPRTVLATQAAA
jgi:hypothetical protein